MELALTKEELAVSVLTLFIHFGDPLDSFAGPIRLPRVRLSAVRHVCREGGRKKNLLAHLAQGHPHSIFVLSLESIFRIYS